MFTNLNGNCSESAMAIVDDALDFAETAVQWSPWLILAGAGGFAYLRHRGPSKQRMHLLMQVAGSLGTYVLILVEWVVMEIILHFDWYKVVNPAHIIFMFLIFVTMMIFAAGYTLEKLAKPTLVAVV